MWDLPKGCIEKGETIKSAAIREVKEECNLDFTPTKIIKIGIWEEKKYYRFLGNWSGEIKIQETEVASYNWFSFSEANKLQLSFDYKEILEILYSQNLL